MLPASICLMPTHSMNRISKAKSPYLLPWILLILLMVAGCSDGTVAVTIQPPVETLPAAPVATLTPEPASEIAAAYPPPEAMPSPSPRPSDYPVPATVNVIVETAVSPSITPDEPQNSAIFVPMIGEGTTPTSTPEPTATAVPPTATAVPPTATPTGDPLPTPTPTRFAPVDFESARVDLASGGEDLVYNKVGFHVTFLEDRDELDTWMTRLDEAGVPMMLKSVDNAEPVYRAQELMKASGVPHVLVFRSTAYDVPDYSMPARAAAEMHWELEKATWPPELDPSLVWFETMNEVDRNRAGWLAEFSLRTAELALRDGYKWAGFGWASGEPEPAAWESPAMLELLRLIADNPDQLAIALHEYSYIASDIADQYPYKVGRFLELFRTADRHGIPRPTTLITEWGWTYNDLPPLADAMEDVTWAAELYGAYPQVLGAAIWNLGKLDDTILPINQQAQDMLDPMMVFSLDSYFSAPRLPDQTTLDPALFPPPN